LRGGENQIDSKTTNEQTPERVTVKKLKIDDEVIALDVVRRAEKRFVFEIMRDNRIAASSDDHKTAKGAAKAGKPIGSGAAAFPSDRQGRSRLPSPSNEGVKRCVAQDPITLLPGVASPMQRRIL
jgi:hypothetical protein